MKNTLNSTKKFWEVKAEAPKRGAVYIYGTIVSHKWDESGSDVTAKDFKDDLESLGDIDALDVYINSPGGSVFQGQAIYSILKRIAETVELNIYVDGLAASIASVIAMAGKVTMPKNAMMMIHNPWSIAVGNASKLRKEADALDKIRVSLIEAYMSKATISEEKLEELLDAETWLTAQECYDYGLCDVLVEEKEVAASVDPEIMKHYRNVPKELSAASVSATPPPPEPPNTLLEEERKARLAAAEANRKKVKTILGGL